MKRRALTLMLTGGLCGLAGHFVKLQAQQTTQFTQTMLTTLSYNPGVAGLSNGLCISGLYRQQWGAIYDGAAESRTKVNPWNALLLVDAPVKVLKGALSAEVLTDNIGFFKDVSFKLGYTYHLQTSFGHIGIGAQGVFLNKKASYSKYKPVVGGDNTLTGEGDESAMFGDVTVGAYLQGSRDYFVGVSVAHLVPQQNEDMGYHVIGPHLYLNGGYNFSFPDLPKAEFTAAAFMQTDFRRVDWSVSGMATFNRRIWGGVSVRMDALSVLAGINISKLRIGAAYDISLNKLTKASAMAGSLGVFIKYCFKLDTDKVNTVYKNARYL